MPKAQGRRSNLLPEREEVGASPTIPKLGLTQKQSAAYQELAEEGVEKRAVSPAKIR